jgi:hypothetical protein
MAISYRLATRRRSTAKSPLPIRPADCRCWQVRGCVVSGTTSVRADLRSADLGSGTTGGAICVAERRSGLGADERRDDERGTRTTKIRVSGVQDQEQAPRRPPQLRAMRPCGRSRRLGWVTPRTFRKTVAGVPVHVLQRIAGHGSITTTQRYLHPDRRSIEAAGAALSAHIQAGWSPTGGGVVHGDRAQPPDDKAADLRVCVDQRRR